MLHFLEYWPKESLVEDLLTGVEYYLSKCFQRSRCILYIWSLIRKQHKNCFTTGANWSILTESQTCTKLPQKLPPKGIFMSSGLQQRRKKFQWKSLSQL